MKQTYFFWAVERIGKRAFKYMILLPILLVIYPVTALGNAMGALFYKLR